jgi:uncharacterized hydrophobic protein (TIGR00271 family)
MVIIRGQRRTLEELGEELFLDVGDVATKRWRFAILLMMAAIIATAGLLADSTATVIGAMIVAPLGTPIMGTGLGIVTGNGRRMVASALTVLIGGAGVFAIGWVLAAILPDLVPLDENSQIIGRVSPSLIDLVAAVATGFAGAYGLARKDVSDVMPGVAIAISLVPPLAVVGITAQAGDMDGAFGAFQLFASNVLAMIVAGSILFTIYGYANEAIGTPGFRKGWAYALVGAATVLIAIPLTITTIDTVRTHTIVADAKAAAEEWVEGTDASVVRADYVGPELVLLIQDLDDLPQGDLVADLTGAVPSGTAVVVNRVGGELVEMGNVP